MAGKKRGRKKLAKKDKKVVVYTMVPAKNKPAAQLEINNVGEKYCN